MPYAMRVVTRLGSVRAVHREWGRQRTDSVCPCAHCFGALHGCDGVVQLNCQVVHHCLRALSIRERHPVERLQVVLRHGVEQAPKKGVDLGKVGGWRNGSVSACDTLLWRTLPWRNAAWCSSIQRSRKVCLRLQQLLLCPSQARDVIQRDSKERCYRVLRLLRVRRRRQQSLRWGNQAIGTYPVREH
jgi:hypothetical protein